jgi:SAM-dependent methyltransferase
MSAVEGRWDEEYRVGRYAGEAPLAFNADILDAANARGLRSGLYIGCGNGRNFVPLTDAGLDLIGLDVSSAALHQLAARRPDGAGRLVHGDLHALAPGVEFELVIGLQVFQHGREADAHAHLRAAIARVAEGGLFCIRVNAVGTQLEYPHRVIETNAEGGFTVVYDEGPKSGLAVHFFARTELEEVTGGLTPVLPLRIDRTHREPPATGYWDQWEGIWDASSRSST